MTTPQRPNQTSTDALWQRWRKDNCADARRELLGRYLGLVHHAARETVSYTHLTLPPSDLV